MPDNQQHIESLSVSAGTAFPELRREDGDENALSTTLPTRTRRTRRRDTFPRAVEKRQTQNVVKRTKIFTSIGHPSFDGGGFATITNGNSLAVNFTVTDDDGVLWLMVPEFSFFIDSFANSNEWPNGSFFSSASARQDPDNYTVISTIKQQTSTDAAIKWSLRFTNNTGVTLGMGLTAGIRFVVNIDRGVTST